MRSLASNFRNGVGSSDGCGYGRGTRLEDVTPWYVGHPFGIGGGTGSGVGSSNLSGYGTGDAPGLGHDESIGYGD